MGCERKGDAQEESLNAGSCRKIGQEGGENPNRGERGREEYIIYNYKQLYLSGTCREVTHATHGHQCL